MTHSTFGTRHTRIFLYTYVKENYDNAISFKQNLEHAKAIFISTYLQSMMNKAAAADRKTQLWRTPFDTSDAGVCVQVGFAKQAVAAYKMLTDTSKDHAVDECIATYIGDAFIGKFALLSILFRQVDLFYQICY